MARPVTVTGTGYINDHSYSSIYYYQQYLKQAFLNNQWNVIDFYITSTSFFDYDVAFSFKFIVDGQFSANQILQNAAAILNNYTIGDATGADDSTQAFSNVSLQVNDPQAQYEGQPAPVYTQPAKTTSSNSNTPKTIDVGTIATVTIKETPDAPDWIDKLAAQLKVSRQTMIWILVGGGVLLLKKVADD